MKIVTSAGTRVTQGTIKFYEECQKELRAQQGRLVARIGVLNKQMATLRAENAKLRAMFDEVCEDLPPSRESR